MLEWLLSEHHILPGDYYGRPEGEKVLLRALFLYTMERRRDKAWDVI